MSNKDPNYKKNTLNYEYETESNHDRMIEAFQQYFIWQAKFEYNNSNYAGTKARYWLSQIRIHASARRVEILDIRKARTKARNGKPGRPRR